MFHILFYRYTLSLSDNNFCFLDIFSGLVWPLTLILRFLSYSSSKKCNLESGVYGWCQLSTSDNRKLLKCGTKICVCVSHKNDKPIHFDKFCLLSCVYSFHFTTFEVQVIVSFCFLLKNKGSLYMWTGLYLYDSRLIGSIDNFSRWSTRLIWHGIVTTH